MQNILILKVDSMEIQELISSDKKLGKLIETVGDYVLKLHTDCFLSLVKSIIGQQLSIKAAQTIWTRVQSACDVITPETILKTEDDIFRNVGVSRSKISYIKNLSQKIAVGELDFNEICLIDDSEAIIQKLTTVKGIGRWTAEMFLIFTLGRIDVFSADDVGLKRAIKWLYEFDEVPDPKTMKAYGEKWAPYGTVASLYLWEVVNRGWVNQSTTEFLSSK